MTDATTDVICPFLIDSGLSRGQAVRLTSSLDTIISQHNYPEPIGILMAQAAVLTALLASTIKFDGVFTLQIQGRGPVSVLAVDITTDGSIRGYARFDEAAVEKAQQAVTQENAAPVQSFFADGTLSFNVETKDQSYQGIVALDQPTLAECVLEYFKQSEQIQTAVKIAVATPAQTGKGWTGAAVMLQRMPMDRQIARELKENEIEDLWNTAVVLLHSATPKELLDTELPLEKLLYRLYHLNNLHFFIQKVIKFGCRCSKDKVIEMLRRFPEQDRKEMAVDGKIKVDCQFCGKSYTLTLKDLDAGK
ncbi:MAG: Hsp33 family molecular chaperone HslO [Alphaproteobacteria bacterium]|nr:Hsp33 family molecular chaperone HslO [Alphaproteobacteria bacterium]